MSKILVIDDDETVREEFRDRIVSMGHECEEARTIQEALEKLKQSAFDCVLLDLGLPVSLEGRPLVANGQNLFGQIVAMPDAPPVIVITAHGLNGPRLAVSMMEMGAVTFIGKGLQDDSLEAKITMVLERRAGTRSSSTPRKPGVFKGGRLLVGPASIELCGETVGGVRKNAIIRKIIRLLLEKSAGRDRNMSRAELAQAIGGSATVKSVASAIAAFREQCKRALGAGRHDVIATSRGGGYQLADWIKAEFSDEPAETRFESDKAAVLRALRRCGECSRKQIAIDSGVPEARLASVMDALDDEGMLLLRGSGSSAVYSLKNT